MKKYELVESFRATLDERFFAAGFEFRKSSDEYLVKKGDFRPCLGLGIVCRTDWFLITPTASVSCPKVNKLYNQLSLKKNRMSPSGPTICFGIENETNHERGRYFVEQPNEVSAAAEGIWQDYIDIGRPFFQSVQSLEAVDAYLNNEGKIHTVWTASLAVIAAHLERKTGTCILRRH